MMVKGVFIGILSFATSVTVTGQKQVLKTEKGVHYKDVRLNDFIGLWEYRNADETFRIQFNPRRLTVGEYSIDVLYAYHNYIKKGDTINYSIKNDFTYTIKDIYSSAQMENGDGEVLYIKFNDVLHNKRGSGRLKFLDTEKTRVKWTLGPYEREQMVVLKEDEPFPVYREGFSVPTEMVLHKVIDD